MPADAKPSLCIINFNGKSVLPTALSAAWALRDRFAEMFVVDNGSNDGSVDHIERDYPGMRVIRLSENFGAGGARNVGLQRAEQDLILFIDNDVALTAECVDRLVDAVHRYPRAALAAASIVYAHQREMVQYDGAECHFLGLQTLLDENVPVGNVGSTVRSVGSIVTCAFLAVRSRLPAGEIFDESFFYMFEDHDFGVRVRVLGAEVLSVPAAFCYHGKGTEGLSIRQLGSYSSKRVYYLIRNRWLFVLKNFSLRTLLIMSPLFVFYELSQLLLAIKKGWLKEWWESVVWIIRNSREIWRQRRRIQTRRVVPDRQILIGGRVPFRDELTASALERIARVFLNFVVVTYWKVAGRLI
jgi:GT2 family glycosyltransferase